MKTISMNTTLLKALLCLVLTIPFSGSFAQINFEHGYYLTNSGEKIRGVIANELWREAPESFTFRDSLGQDRTISLEEASCFAIDGKEKYVRATVNIDISIHKERYTEEQRAPIFETKTTFLLVRSEGDASLYEYLWTGPSRFFLSTDNGESFVPLIQKLYWVNDHQVGENNQFRQQLLANLSHKGVVLDDVKNLSYSTRELVKFLNEVNGVRATKEPFAGFIRDRTEFALKGGLTFWTLDVYRLGYANVYGPAAGIQVGADFALLFPKEKATFAVSIAPNFRYLGLSTEFNQEAVSIKYTSLDVPFGVRMYLGRGSAPRFFVGAGYNLIFNIPGSEFQVGNRSALSLLTEFGDTAFYGEVGVVLDKKYSIQAIYQRRELFPGTFGDVNMTSLVFGIIL